MIRSMTHDDIRQVQKIAQISWQHTYNGIIPEEVQLKFLNMAYSDAMLQKRMEKTHMLLAESDGKIVGFAAFTETDEDGDAELTAIYLLPEYQEMGIGTQLLQAGLELLEDARQLFVYVECANMKGRSFYEAKGFEFVEEFEELFEGYPLYTAQYVYYVKAPVFAG